MTQAEKTQPAPAAPVETGGRFSALLAPLRLFKRAFSRSRQPDAEATVIGPASRHVVEPNVTGLTTFLNDSTDPNALRICKVIRAIADNDMAQMDPAPHYPLLVDITVQQYVDECRANPTGMIEKQKALVKSLGPDRQEKYRTTINIWNNQMNNVLKTSLGSIEA